MLITNFFVMLNSPKTGSTFTRTVIKELHRNKLAKQSAIENILQKFSLMKKPMCEELLLPNIRLKGVERVPNQHGTYSQIPDRYRHLPVVSIIRNPYSRFMSGYKFRWWASHPPINDLLLDEHFPNFPDLSVDDFVKLAKLIVTHGVLGEKKVSAEVGNQTVQFIQFFFKNPNSILENLTDDYLDAPQVVNDLADITFLRQENLNEDLANFLANFKYSDDEINYVKTRARVNVTKTKTPSDRVLWTQNSIEYVQRRERMLFRLLEMKGIAYKEPEI